jgi:hypothetical protein
LFHFRRADVEVLEILKVLEYFMRSILADEKDRRIR